MFEFMVFCFCFLFGLECVCNGEGTLRFMLSRWCGGMLQGVGGGGEPL